VAPLGPRPKPQGQRRNRTPLVHSWVEVENAPFTDGPDLPPARRSGQPWPGWARERWDAWRSMPHAKLWRESDRGFAVDTIEVACQYLDGGPTGLVTELRNREKILGTTLDARRDLRIRYTEPGASDAPSSVTSLDEYRYL
jgi:hypothetical protein